MAPLRRGAFLAFAPSAFAADYNPYIPVSPVTVGPATFTRWAGFYFGGQVGYSGARADFSKASEPLVGFSLRDLVLEAQDMPSTFQVLRNAGTNVTGFGGFVGYNSQWQDLVLGFEANYTHSPFTIIASSSPISLVLPAGSNTDSVNISANASLSMTDYGLVASARRLDPRRFSALWFCRFRDRARQLRGRHARIRTAGDPAHDFAMRPFPDLRRFFLPQ